MKDDWSFKNHFPYVQIYILLLGLGKVSFNKTSRNGLKVAKAGHMSEGRMGMMADRPDS